MSGSAGASERERVVLTGGRGFVGQRMAEKLEHDHPDWELLVCGGPHDGGGAALDVTDTEAVARLIAHVRPTILIHLAAVSAVTASIADPRAAWTVNLGGALNVTEALAAHAPECRLLYVSSAEVYGRSLADRAPVAEDALLQPLNPYAASKAAADILVRQCAAGGLRALVARPFNHTGAGQSEVFVVPAFAAQIARIERGLQPPVLKVGSLDDERDFLDVGDVVDAYAAMLQGWAGLPNGAVFNVASGAPRRIGDVLETLLGLSTAAIRVEVDPARVRNTVVRVVAGDATRLRDELGWTPRVDLKDTLAAVLEDQRSHEA